VYAFSIFDINASDVLTVYIDNDGTYEGCVTTKLLDNISVSGLNVYSGEVIVRDETLGGITNTDLDNADNGDDDIKYNVSSGNLSIDTGFKLLVWNGDIFTPDGNVSTINADCQIVGILNINNNNLTLGGFGNLDVDGTLTVTSGTITVNGNLDNSGIINLDHNDAELDVNGDITNTGTIDSSGVSSDIFVSDDWNNTGTFTAGVSTVKFDGTGTSKIYGSTTFYDFTSIGKTLNFEGGSTQTITGTLTLQGGVLSSTNGGEWHINPQSGTSITNVTVSDSYNDNGVYINPPSSIDAGGNTYWFDPDLPEPPEPPAPPPVNQGFQDTTGGQIFIQGMSTSDEEQEKYKKWYKKGKYRTVVIVLEGKVVTAPYDEEGPKFNEGTAIGHGEEHTVEGEIVE